MMAYSEPRRCGSCGGVQYQARVDVSMSADVPGSKTVRGRWEECQDCGSIAEPVDMPRDPFIPVIPG